MCLEMKVDGVTKWIVVHHQASSLFGVIADGIFKNTNVGKDPWRSLMDSSLLQEYCNKEGFNLQSRGVYGVYVETKIGLLANDENHCNLCHSIIGFGTSILSCDGDLTSVSCGTSKAGCGGNPNEIKAAFGYILYSRNLGQPY